MSDAIQVAVLFVGCMLLFFLFLFMMWLEDRRDKKRIETKTGREPPV